jgi:hypothetical protein
MRKQQYVAALPAADREKVQAILEYLVSAFERLCNESPEPIEYLNAAMGVHNFHKAILFDLTERAEMPQEQRRVFLTAMRHTFDEAIDREIKRISH